MHLFDHIFFCKIIAFVIVELLALFIFNAIGNIFKEKSHNVVSSVIKGILERLVLYIGLLMNITSVLIFFGAIKIATRIKDDNENKITNDYFLVGNLVSMLLVFLTLLLNYLFVEMNMFK